MEKKENLLNRFFQIAIRCNNAKAALFFLNYIQPNKEHTIQEGIEYAKINNYKTLVQELQNHI